MSVVKSKRGETTLTVLTKARELSIYTIRICSNEKNFPKHYRWCITAKIVDATIDINNNVNMANAVYVKEAADRGIMTRKQCDECYASWKAHAQRGNTHNLIIQMDKFYKELWRGNNVQIKDGKTAIARRTEEERGT